jgi:hypothetical protein
VIANWTVAIPALRAKMLNRGLLLPDHPITDGKWHSCGLGWYNLSPVLPMMALFHNPADGLAPSVWQADEHRRMTMSQELRVGDAIAQLPAAPTKYADLRANAPSRSSPSVHSALEAAKRVLSHLLAHGPVATEEVRAQTARAGASWATVRRAAALLGVTVERIGFGGSGRWLWRLP